MAAIEGQYLIALKNVINERFMPLLTPSLDKMESPSQELEKQKSRAFSAFVVSKLIGLNPKDAVACVVDGYGDKGLDAIFYAENSGVLYIVQSKLKESEQFKQSDALSFCDGVRLLLAQKFSLFNKNIQARKIEIEGALDACNAIKLVIACTGDGVSKAAEEAMNSLLYDDDLDEDRLDKNIIFYMADEIKHDLLAEMSYSPVNARVYLQKHAKVEVPRATYYGVSRLKDLLDLHREHGKSLYERNIRYYIGSDKSDVNKEIKSTLRSAPGDFFT